MNVSLQVLYKDASSRPFCEQVQYHNFNMEAQLTATSSEFWIWTTLQLAQAFDLNRCWIFTSFSSFFHISRQLLFKHVAYHNFNMDLQLNASWCDFWGDTSATNSNILLNRVRLQPLSVAAIYHTACDWVTYQLCQLANLQVSMKRFICRVFEDYSKSKITKWSFRKFESKMWQFTLKSWHWRLIHRCQPCLDETMAFTKRPVPVTDLIRFKIGLNHLSLWSNGNFDQQLPPGAALMLLENNTAVICLALVVKLQCEK